MDKQLVWIYILGLDAISYYIKVCASRYYVAYGSTYSTGACGGTQWNIQVHIQYVTYYVANAPPPSSHSRRYIRFRNEKGSETVKLSELGYVDKSWKSIKSDTVQHFVWYRGGRSIVLYDTKPY